jgi:hypothetical protein
MLWLWTGLLSGAALVPTYTKEGNAIVPFVVAGLALALFALFHPGVRVARKEQERALHPAGGAAATTTTTAPGVVDLASARRKRA